MPLAKCPRCKALWNRTPGVSVCAECQPEETAEYEVVRDCLSSHPGLNAENVAEKTGVNPKTIVRMLKEGLIARESDLGPAKCGQCGAPAISHKKRLCEKCLHKLNSQVMATRKHIEEDIAASKDEQDKNISARELLQQKRR